MPIIDVVKRVTRGTPSPAVVVATPPPGRPRVFVGGKESRTLDDALRRLAIDRRESESATCVAVFDNGPRPGERRAGPAIDLASVDFGTALSIALGDAGTVFRGKVTALRVHAGPLAAATVEVTAEDALLALRQTTRTRGFARSSLADIASRIAGDHGLTPDVSVSTSIFDQVAQVETTDLDFLRARFEEVDAYFVADDRSLRGRARRVAEGATVALALGNELLDLTVRTDVGDQRSHVIGSTWGIADAQRLASDAGVAAIRAETGAGRIGVEVLEQRFGRRSGHLPLASTSAARVTERAEAAFRTRARHFATARAVVAGAPAVAVGGRVDISGAPARCGGVYRVAAIRHTFDGAAGTGIRTELELERAWTEPA